MEMAKLKLGDSDRESFVKAVQKAMDEADASRLQRWRVNRRLRQRRFVDFAMVETANELFWDDPESFEGLIDWENLDVEKLRAIFEMIMEIIMMFM